MPFNVLMVIKTQRNRKFFIHLWMHKWLS